MDDKYRYNVKDFGAKGDGSTDDTAAIQLAVDSIAQTFNKGGILFFPAGTYKITSAITFATGVSIVAMGSGNSRNPSVAAITGNSGLTRIIQATLNTDAFTVNGLSCSFLFMDIIDAHLNVSTPTSGAAITSNGYATQYSNVFTLGFFDGIHEVQTQNMKMDWCTLYDGVRSCLYLENQTNSDLGDSCISNTDFLCGVNSTLYGVYSTSSSGNKFINCKWNAGTNPMADCVRFNNSGSANFTSDNFFCNCSFENFTGYAIKFLTASGAVSGRNSIMGGNISSFHSGSAINLNASAAAAIFHFSIYGTIIDNCTNGIVATNVDFLTINLGGNNTAGAPQTLTTCTHVTNDLNTALLANSGTQIFTGPMAFANQTEIKSTGDLVFDASSGSHRDVAMVNVNSGADNLGGVAFVPNATGNYGVNVGVMPSGSGFAANFISQLFVYATDPRADAVNFLVMNWRARTDFFQFASGAFGSKTNIPIFFSCGGADGTTNTDQFWLNVDGSIKQGYGQRSGRTTVANTAYTIVVKDYLIAFTSLTATRAVTLPSAATVPNQHFVIKDEAGTAGTNAITIVGTIDGANNPTVINTNYGKYRFYSNGTAFFTE